MLALALLLCGAAPTLPSAAADTATLYLPSLPAALPAEAVVTASGNLCNNPFGCGYPDYYGVRGYVRNLSSTPLYSVTLQLSYGGSSYCPEEPGCGDYSQTIDLEPTISVLLPGQAIPFSHSIVVGKASVSWANVTLLRASTSALGGGTAHALTVVSSQREGMVVTGVVRNDSGFALDDAEVLVTRPDFCENRRAVLAATDLAPGQSTTFRADFVCANDNYGVVGYGMAR
jgi:hypothetical protein